MDYQVLCSMHVHQSRNDIRFLYYFTNLGFFSSSLLRNVLVFLVLGQLFISTLFFKVRQPVTFSHLSNYSHSYDRVTNIDYNIMDRKILYDVSNTGVGGFPAVTSLTNQQQSKYK